MRIVHVLMGGANPESMNGVNKAVHFMATGHARAGHEVEVWGITNPPKTASHDTAYRFRPFPATTRRFVLSKVLREALAGLSSDTWVQLHSVYIPEFTGITRRLRKAGINYGLTPHGGYTAHPMQRNRLLKSMYVSLFDRRTLGGSRFVQALGEGEKRDILRLNRRCNVICIPYGQCLDLPGVRGEKPSLEPTFVYCGRLDSAHKGLDLMLDGFADYVAAGGSGKLWIIGEGVDRRDLARRAARPDLSGRVVFWGAKFAVEKYRLLAQGDAFVHVSRWEGMPTACLEAAASCLPLLITPETNLGEYVAKWDSGLVVAAATRSKVAEGFWWMKERHRDGTIVEYGRRARKMVETEFVWSRVCDRLLQAWCTPS